MTKYLEWNYDTGIVTECQRLGKCKQCGKCCKAKITFEICKPRRNNNRNGGAMTNETGIWSEINRGRWRYFFKIKSVDLDTTKCESLTDDNLCQHHGDKDPICGWWPFSPKCIDLFPDCGYSFEKINEWQIVNLS